MKNEDRKGKNRILVVGHAPESSGLIVALQEAMYDVRSASSPVDVLAQLGAYAPDMVVVEVCTSESTGIDIAECLSTTDIPFIFFSVHDDLSVATRAIECGAFAYVVKQLSLSPSAHVIPTISAGIIRDVEVRRLRATEKVLRAALDSSRATNTAVGVMMERYKLDRHSAFDKLRERARSGRRKLNELALELINAVELLNFFPPSTPGAAPRAAAHADRRTSVTV